MKNLGILIVIVVILLAFGAGSAGLLPGLPIITQTADPNASMAQATPEQANQLFFWVVFVLVNLIGAGVTIALLMWFLGRSTSRVRSMPNKPPAILNRSRPATLASGDTSAQLPEKTT